MLTNCKQIATNRYQKKNPKSKIFSTNINETIQLGQKQNEPKHAKLIHENETLAINHEFDEIKREKTEYNTYN
jgi:hypothetical protein